jgi:hypothetical protein
VSKVGAVPNAESRHFSLRVTSGEVSRRQRAPPCDPMELFFPATVFFIANYGKCVFAASLVVGLGFRPTFLERVLGGLLKLTESGWRVLTLAWAAFALLLAGLNEFVWRSIETETWVTFKTAIPISLAGYILITRVVAPRWWNPGSRDVGHG